MSTNRAKIFIRVFLTCLILIPGTGCQTFRWGEYTSADLEKRQREQHQMDHMMFKPGSLIYSWHP